MVGRQPFQLHRRLALEGHYVAHTEQGRQFLYRARLAPEQVQKNLVGDLVSRLFDGDPLALVNHLLRAGEIEPDELDDLRRRVVDAERKQKKERP